MIEQVKIEKTKATLYTSTLVWLGSGEWKTLAQTTRT